MYLEIRNQYVDWLTRIETLADGEILSEILTFTKELEDAVDVEFIEAPIPAIKESVNAILSEMQNEAPDLIRLKSLAAELPAENHPAFEGVHIFDKDKYNNLKGNINSYIKGFSFERISDQPLKHIYSIDYSQPVHDPVTGNMQFDTFVQFISDSYMEVVVMAEKYVMLLNELDIEFPDGPYYKQGYGQLNVFEVAGRVFQVKQYSMFHITGTQGNDTSVGIVSVNPMGEYEKYIPVIEEMMEYYASQQSSMFAYTVMGGELFDVQHSVFTKSVYLFTNALKVGDKELLHQYFHEKGYFLRIRDDEHRTRRTTHPLTAIVSAFLTETEGKDIEFKTTLQFSMTTSKRDSGVQMTALKSIASLMNTNGGTLLIGIDDQKNIIGLGPDYSILKGPDFRDSWNLALDDLIYRSMNRSIHALLKVNIVPIDGRDVAVIKVEKSSVPIWAKDLTNKLKPTFYIRANGGTAKLMKKEEVEAYLVHRFPEHLNLFEQAVIN